MEEALGLALGFHSEPSRPGNRPRDIATSHFVPVLDQLSDTLFKLKLFIRDHHDRSLLTTDSFVEVL